MPGVKVRAIREQLGVVLRGAGFAPSGFHFSRIGSDAGSKVHRSYATHAPSRRITDRQKTWSQVETTVQVRVLVHRPLEDKEGFVADDVAEQAVNACLFAFELAGVGGGLEVGSVSTAVHTANPQIDVVTVTCSARHTIWTEPVPEVAP